MTRQLISRFLCAASLAATALLATAGSAAAAEPFVLDAGIACRDFAVQIDSVGTPPRTKEFRDKNGNVVRLITAGKGVDLTLTNVTSGESFSLKANGSVNHTTLHPDGTATVTITGHNVLILFPTDIPRGPSTRLIVGRVVFTVDGFGVFRVQKVSGKVTDICAALAA